MGNLSLHEKATKAGLELIQVSDRVEVRKGKRVIAFHSDEKRALTKAFERLEEDRLRDLDKRPVDREKVLHVKPRQNGHAPRAREARPVASSSDPPMTAPAAPDPLVVSPLPVLAPPLAEALTRGIIKGSIIKSKYKDRYKKNGSYSCGDLIADELRAYLVVMVKGRALVDLAKLKAVAITNEVWKDSYAKLNAGQQRMTIGNRLRARYAEGLQIDIGGCPFIQEFEDV